MYNSFLSYFQASWFASLTFLCHVAAFSQVLGMRIWTSVSPKMSFILPTTQEGINPMLHQELTESLFILNCTTTQGTGAHTLVPYLYLSMTSNCYWKIPGFNKDRIPDPPFFFCRFVVIGTLTCIHLLLYFVWLLLPLQNEIVVTETVSYTSLNIGHMTFYRGMLTSWVMLIPKCCFWPYLKSKGRWAWDS